MYWKLPDRYGHPRGSPDSGIYYIPQMVPAIVTVDDWQLRVYLAASTS